MKSALNKVFFPVFILIWGVLIVANLFLPEKDFSENENRFLSHVPDFSAEALLNGKLMNKTDEYVNDQFIFRDTWISLQSVMEYSLGKRESNSVYICKGSLMDKIAEPNEETVRQNLDGILNFCEEYQLPAYMMIVPSASEIQRDRLPTFAAPWDQAAAIDKIYEALPKVNCIALGDTLKSHSSDYIFYRTDHHWTSYGAYLAYLELCKTINIAPADYSCKTVSSSFNGTLYSRSGVRFVESDSIDAFESQYFKGCEIFDGSSEMYYNSFYFDEYLSKKDKYAYFLGSNQPIITIHGSKGTGKKLLMFKDSFSHCLAPMLLENYDEITLVDLRYVKRSIIDMVDPSNYDDVLFMYGVDTFVSQDDLVKLKYIFSNNA